MYFRKSFHDCDIPQGNKEAIILCQNIETVHKEKCQNAGPGNTSTSKGTKVQSESPAIQSCDKPQTVTVQYNCALCTAAYTNKDEFKVHFLSHQDSIPEGLKKAYHKTNIQEPKVLDIERAKHIAKQIKETNLNKEVVLKNAQEEQRRIAEPMRKPRVVGKGRP